MTIIQDGFSTLQTHNMAAVIKSLDNI